MNDSLLKRMYNTGKSLRDISDVAGESIRDIKTRLWDIFEDVMPDSRLASLYNVGTPIEKIAAEAKVKRCWVTVRLSALRDAGDVNYRGLRGVQDGKEERKEKVLKFRLEGKLTNAQIAEKVGISAQHVRAISSELIKEGKIEGRVNRFA